VNEHCCKKKDHSRDTKVQATISVGRVSDIKILKGFLDKNGNLLEQGTRNCTGAGKDEIIRFKEG